MFMARANAAYYATHDPFADFTTSPEIAQMFGELLGAWAAIVWQSMGAPRPVLLVEAGPGRGTLMADARRATARVAPDFHAACQLHLIETSPRLRAAQGKLVPDAAWHGTLDAVPPGPAIVLANEFLDALPIRQLVRTPRGWAERHVEHASFVDQDLSHPPQDSRIDAQPDLPSGTVLEIAPTAGAWTHDLASRLNAQGGAALILDYGPGHSAPGDSLQALRHGRPADPLADPGCADLTAHVDFEALGRVAREAGASVHGPLAQGIFLERLGLGVRTARLAAARPDRMAALYQAAGRLAEPARMGALFKAMCLTHPGLPVPPGFEP